jgi:hypothetical protein
MRKTGFLLLLLFLVSCAHRRDLKTVQFPYANELLATIQERNSNRLPASIELEAREDKSTRRIYFSSLYYQYLTFGSYLEKTRDLNYCPQFHHDKLEVEGWQVPEVSAYRATHIQPEGKDFFPELVFHQDFSIRDYHEQIRDEIVTLCEEGLSDNFYKFDNLVTHHAPRSSFHFQPEAMKSLLKIPIFANFYLIKMMEKSQHHSGHRDEKLFIEVTRTHWFDSYISTASKKRSHFLRDKMVKR